MTHDPRPYESPLTCTGCAMPVLEHNTDERDAHGITAEHIADANAEHLAVYRRPADAALTGRGVL